MQTHRTDDVVTRVEATGMTSTRVPATDERSGLQTALFSQTFGTPNGLQFTRAERADVEPPAPTGPFDFDTAT